MPKYLSDRHSLFRVFLNQPWNERFEVLAEFFRKSKVGLVLKVKLRSKFYFEFIFGSCDKTELSQQLVHMRGHLCTKGQLFNHILILREFQVQHSHKFRSKFFAFLNRKTWPIQNLPIYRHPEYIKIYMWHYDILWFYIPMSNTLFLKILNGFSEILDLIGSIWFR